MPAIAPRSGGTVAAAAGAGMVALAVVLYATDLSRAVGVVLGAVAAVVLAGGLVVSRRGRLPHRRALIAFALVLAGLIALGIWTLVIALCTAPTPV